MKRFDLVTAVLFLTTVVTAYLPLALRLAALSYENDGYLIPIDNADLLILSGPREYATIVMLTSTVPQHGCDQCENFEEVIKTGARAWFNDYGDTHQLFFVNVDLKYPANSKIFEQLGLDTVPNIWFIPPNVAIEYDTDANSVDILLEPNIRFNVPQGSFDEQVMEFARFLSETTQKNIIIRQADPGIKFLKTFLITLAVILFLKKKGPQFITSIEKKTVQTYFFILATLVCICGYQFTVQEGVPFLATNDKGELIYISGGIHWQFGVEIVIVGANYFALAMSFITLIYFGNYKVTTTSRISDENYKHALILANAALIYFLYSVLTSIFLRKDHDYPYYFTKLF